MSRRLTKNRTNKRSRIFAFCGFLVLWLFSSGNYAGDFALNFQPLDPTHGDNFYPDTRCNRPGESNLGCSGSYSNIGDPTSFLQELFEFNGQWYYHVIVGTPESGFAQEFVMQANGPSWEGGLGSASLGDGSCRLPVFGPGSWDITACNISDPLGESHDNVFTGIGSGNPKAIVMRSIIGGTWNSDTKTWSCEQSDEFCDEFLKSEFLQKPIINQTIHDNNFTAAINIDMSNSTYDMNNLPAEVAITLELDEPSDFSSGDFGETDVIPGFQNSSITAGRYIFSGSGPTNASSEPYIYYDGGFELDRDWSIFAPP